MTHSGQGPEQQYPAAQPLPPEVTPGGSSDAQATQYLPPVPAQPPVAPQAGYGYPPPAPPQQHQQPQPQSQQGYGYPPAPQQHQPQQQQQQHQQQPQPGYGYPPPAPPQHPSQPGYGYPPPAPADAQATQYLPPVVADSQATQLIPPVAPGPGAPGPDMQATQFIAPVPPQQTPPQAPHGGPHAPGERPPLADFENLFRSETPHQASAPVPPVVQHQQPSVQLHQPPHQQQYQPPQPPPQHQQQHHQQQAQQQYGFQEAYYDEQGYDEPEPRRRKSPVALIAAVVAGCAVVGLGAGALLSGGDEDKKDQKGGQNVAASSSAPSAAGGGTTDKAADPAEEQAKQLDKLLADSNNSRDAVIRSVEAIKTCSNLDQAAGDLRGAAEQRRGLVTRLQKLSVDKVPDSGALTAALTKAWQASASADDHYAAWADQAKSKKVCKGGRARSTSQTIEANKKSGEASTAKREAAGLWNPTAEKYGLTKRSQTQL
ncbi:MULTISPECIES: hypothetical protein [unclassified Streptomyces]|uniref:hypothetical protein n=1 Tax=unclassified Streptomyces TaxID=2593676 RepID=UPI002E303C01|nr:hypothetical protein [Streptomyces sp. NBC_01268]